MQTIELKSRVSILVGVTLLLLLIISSYSGEFIRFNFTQGVEFLFSSHFLFFAVSGVILLYKKLSSKIYGAAVFILAFVYEFLYYGRYLSLSSMDGDNICQIAYWNILFRPNLAGSIGTSVTKPGQLVIAGILHQAGTEYGVLIMQVGLCLVMAVAVYSLVMIATDMGGRVASVVVFPVVASYMLHQEFIRNSYSIYLVSALYLGLWCYYYQPKYKGSGRLLLACSLLFHSQVIPILGFVLLLLVWKKDWQELRRFSACILILLTIWIVVVLRVQGSIDRISCGLAVGYPTYGAEIGSSIGGKLVYIASEVKIVLENSYIPQVLFVLMLIGVIGALYYGYRLYLMVFSSLLLLVIYLLLLNGNLNIWRMWMIFYAFSCSVGIGTVVRFSRETLERCKPTELLMLLVTLSLLVMTADLSQFNIYKDIHYAAVNNQNINPNYAATQSAFKNMPQTTRLMTEDCFLYTVVATEPDRFKSLVSLQLFNVESIQRRQEILANIDYILIAAKGVHGGYYMQHLAIPEWRTDPFRLMVQKMSRNKEPQRLYGYRFILFDSNNERLLVKVEPEKV